MVSNPTSRLALPQSVDAERGGGRFPLGLVSVIALSLAYGYRQVSSGAALGHDEAVYALRAVADPRIPSPSYWADYRAPGLPASLLGLSSDAGLRWGVVMWGVAGTLLVWLIANHVAGPRAGFLAGGLVAVTPLWSTAAARIWPDVPGATMCLAVLGVAMAATTGGAVRWWLLGTALLGAGATWVRYGSPLVLAAMAVPFVWWRWPAIRTGVRTVAATAALMLTLTAILLLTTAVSNTVAPALAIARQGTTGADLGDLTGPIEFVYALDDHLRIGLVLLAGTSLAIRASRTERRFIMFMFGSAVLAFLAIGVSVHAEPRYMAPVVPLLALSAAVGVAATARRLPSWGFAILTLALLGWCGWPTEGPMLREHQGDGIRAALADFEFPLDCLIATGSVPQVEWYSGCPAVRFGDNPTVADDAEFVLSLVGGKNQPADLEAVLRGWGSVVAVGGHLDPATRLAALWERAD